MNLERITQIACDQMEHRPYPERERGYIYYHGQRVAELSLRLRGSIEDGVEDDEDVLYVGALFHDVGKWMEPHNEMGAVVVRALLRAECTGREIEAIAGIVREHNRRRTDGCSVYGRIVQDADILDHAGSMGLWLKLLARASHERTIVETLSAYTGADAEEENGRMRAFLNFEASKQVFDQRIAFEAHFLERFKREVNGGF
jgi:uncharacterized protein